jgi:TolB protein
MNATRVKQLTGLMMILGLWINSIAFPVFASPHSLSKTVNKSRALAQRKQQNSNAAMTLVNVSNMTTTDEADVAAYASAEPFWVASSSTVTYTVYVTNYGPDEASSVTLSGTLSPDVTLSTIVNNDGSCTSAPASGGGTNFNCTLGDTDPDITKTITFTGSATAAPFTSLPFVSTVASNTDDPYNWNNEANTDARIATAPLPTPTPGPTPEDQLAYISPGNNNSTDIFRQRADGAGLLNLTDNSAYEDTFLWSPDGSQLAFLRNDSANLTVSLCVMDADGSNLALLTNVTDEGIDYFAWSPDGSQLIFNAHDYNTDGLEGEIYVINADGTGRTSLSGANGFNTEPSWSPDGTYISYLRLEYPPESAPVNHIYVANADGTGQISITHDEGDTDYNPTWSPDGTKLAFTRYFSNNTDDIFTVDADGTDLQRLTNDAYPHFSAPQWSPDGTKLLFSSYRPDGLSIETMDADGTDRTTLYTPPENSLNSAGGEKWSPDGTMVAFQYIVGEYQGGNACVVNADGTGLLCLGNDLEFNLEPEWSPDSSRLAFTSRRNGVPSIDLINNDGTGRVELTSQGDYYGTLKWRPVP